MPGSGTRTFLEPHHFEASLRQAEIELIITCPGQFEARLTWAELHYLQVLRCEEDFPRVGSVCFRPGLAFVIFPLQSGHVPVWRGTQLQPNQIMLVSGGGRLHQWTAGPSIWGLIVLNQVPLELYSQALSGKPFFWRSETEILLPSPRDAARLRRLHAQVCRLAETKPRTLSHSEVARALEQGLIHALVTCLTTTTLGTEGSSNSRQAGIMIRFEEVLTKHLSDPRFNMAQLCQLIGVTERALRSCCAEIIGMTPPRYILLRRLRQVRIALREAHPGATDVAELARRCGFTQMAQFASAYLAAFGETPTVTLQRAPELRFAIR